MAYSKGSTRMEAKLSSGTAREVVVNLPANIVKLLIYYLLKSILAAKVMEYIEFLQVRIIDRKLVSH